MALPVIRNGLPLVNADGTPALCKDGGCCDTCATCDAYAKTIPTSMYVDIGPRDFTPATLHGGISDIGGTFLLNHYGDVGPGGHPVQSNTSCWYFGAPMGTFCMDSPNVYATYYPVLFYYMVDSPGWYVGWGFLDSFGVYFGLKFPQIAVSEGPGPPMGPCDWVNRELDYPGLNHSGMYWIDCVTGNQENSLFTVTLDPFLYRAYVV